MRGMYFNCCSSVFRRFKKLFILSVIAITILMLLNRHVNLLTGFENLHFTARYLTKLQGEKAAQEADGLTCKLPELDPYHSDVMEVMEEYGPLVCNEKQYSRLENGTLYVNIIKGVRRLWYREISRANDSDDRDFKTKLRKKIYIKGIVDEQGEIKIPTKSEFIEVTINRYHKELHLQVTPKEEVLNRSITTSELPLNVFIIMFDSTSAAQFQRKLKKTNEYLKNDLDTVFFKGESVVGDGTTAQVSALLTGKPEERQPEARRGKPGAESVDNWDWVFRDYKNKGYATMFSEDDASIAAINYRLKGFGEPPTDHYARPFWIQFDKKIVKMTEDKLCAGDRPIHNISFNYLEDFAEAYPDRPKLGVLFFSYLTHGDQNALSYADDDLVQLLKNLDRKSHLNNSMVIIMGDHGYRVSSWRKTTHGKLEERLPHLSITLPNWFNRKYPELYRNFKSNAKLLTSPFDIYAILKHILSYPSEPRNIITGQSLFNRIDKDSRTCASAGIESHWCPCMTWEKMERHQQIGREITQTIIDHLNNITLASSDLPTLCRELKLEEIKSLSKEIPNERVLTFVETKKNNECDSCDTVHGKKSRDTLQMYQVQFVTTPGGGFFEASVRMNDGYPVVDSRFISRLNLFGNQSHCVASQPHLLKFCYCKEQLSEQIKVIHNTG